MQAPRAKPASSSRRPPEPFRPLPATRRAVTVLDARARRRRLRRPRAPSWGDGPAGDGQWGGNGQWGEGLDPR